MDLTAWIVTLAGLIAMAWVVWYFWIYDEPVDEQRMEKKRRPLNESQWYPMVKTRGRGMLRIENKG